MSARAPSRREQIPAQAFNVAALRADFPILGQTVHGKALVYLDNAATSQKPSAVINAIAGYYRSDNANIHRGVHTLSERATAAYEQTRARIRRFLNAASEREVIFVRGTTEAVNLVAQSYGRSVLTAGDEIIISALEHHSNIVPWQLLCGQIGTVLKVIPMNDRGELLLDEYRGLLGRRTKLVSIAHVSNALGTVNPVKEIIDLARDHGAATFVDGAQAVAHLPVDVQALGCDFYAFSSHKVYGPTGVGVLYGRESLLERMPPYQGGGDMIKTVSFERSTYNDLPYKFEAGTPHIAGTIGLGAAIDYLQSAGFAAVAEHEHEVLAYATECAQTVPGLRLIGTAARKTGVLSFVMDGIHPHDIGTILDHEGIAIRTGHHCAMPVMEYFGIPATARASFALYNTVEEVDRLVRGLARVREVFG